MQPISLWWGRLAEAPGCGAFGESALRVEGIIFFSTFRLARSPAEGEPWHMNAGSDMEKGGPRAEADEAGASGARKEVDPRMHSAEHVLTATLMAVLGCGRPFTTHIEKKKSKADYRFNRDLTAEEIGEIERRVNAAVSADLPVREEFLPRDKAAQQFDLHRLPDAAGERIRIIRVGDYDACPCSGPHVRSTKEIGGFRIVSTSFEEGALRVRFKLTRMGLESPPAQNQTAASSPRPSPPFEGGEGLAPLLI